MKIVGFDGAFREGNFFEFPKNKNYKLMSFDDAGKENADAYVTTGVKGYYKSYGKQYDYITQTKKPVIVFEGASFRRGISVGDENYYYRVGLNDYTFNRGVFYNENSKPDRWNMIQKEQGIEIKPWRNKGDYILVCLQNPTDTSLNDLYTQEVKDKLTRYTKGDDIQYNYINYLYSVVLKISKFTKEPIVIRFHPRFLEKYGAMPSRKVKGGFFTRFKQKGMQNEVIYSGNYDGWNETNGGAGFQKDLDNARVVVSFSSNAMVESVCEGIPTISLSRTSHAWPVSYHNLDIISENNIQGFDRQQWLNNLAYTQWKQEEIESGYVHERLLK
jgi:hypothetical protein